MTSAAGSACQEAELLTIGAQIAFRHPLVRSAVYSAASPEARSRVHRALAEATSQQADPDRRAWHLAHSAEDRDDAVAAELEASAGRALSRGGLAAAAAFRERAASLTTDPASRAERELAAAEDKYLAGAPQAAQVLLNKVESGPHDALRSARVRQMRGHLAFVTGDADLAPGPAETAFASWALSEFVEAAVRCGDHAQVEWAVDRLARTTTPSATQWGLGIEARSRALISDGSAADELYREAIDRLGRSRGVVATARAHLLYGEWLRRQDRESEARGQLSTAHAMFAEIGAQAFANRTRFELAACGRTVPEQRSASTAAALTEQERLIARRARDGLSNPEIGAELFLSARTVEWHLRKVFTKLGISSRRELDNVLD